MEVPPRTTGPRHQRPAVLRVHTTIRILIHSHSSIPLSTAASAIGAAHHIVPSILQAVSLSPPLSLQHSDIHPPTGDIPIIHTTALRILLHPPRRRRSTQNHTESEAVIRSPKYVGTYPTFSLSSQFSQPVPPVPSSPSPSPSPPRVHPTAPRLGCFGRFGCFETSLNDLFQPRFCQHRPRPTSVRLLTPVAVVVVRPFRLSACGDCDLPTTDRQPTDHT